MKTTAAILVEPGRELVVDEVDTPRLGEGQVLVEVESSGVCHTQILEARGHRGEDPWLPHCLGHEGAGVVLERGPGVRKVAPGDRVVLSWMAGSGAQVPSIRYDWRGRVVNAGGVTTFNRHAVVSENRLTRLPDGLDFAPATLLGCAIPTGLGAVTNVAGVRPGQSVAVFGAGGIGLCAVAGAFLAGATPVLAVDLVGAKLRIAALLGASVTIDAREEDPIEEIRRHVPGGLDFAIEATGRPAVMRQALAAVRPRGGAVVVIGNARSGEKLELDPRELNQGKRLLGTWGGDNDPDRDFPRYARLLVEGRLDLAPLVGARYPLERVNDALADLEAGREIRPILDLRGS